MKNKIYCFAIFLASFACIGQLSAQVKEITPAYIQEKISAGKSYFLVFLKKGTNRESDPQKLEKLQMQHLQTLFSLKEQGKLPLFGPLMEDGDLRGICIFNVADAEEVRKLMAKDPFIQSGHLVLEIHPWFGLPGDTLPK